MVKEAMEVLMYLTGVRFVETDVREKMMLTIKSSYVFDVFKSTVGYVPFATMELDTNSSMFKIYVIVHELKHVLSFLHMH